MQRFRESHVTTQLTAGAVRSIATKRIRKFYQQSRRSAFGCFSQGKKKSQMDPCGDIKEVRLGSAWPSVCCMWKCLSSRASGHEPHGTAREVNIELRIRWHTRNRYSYHVSCGFL